MGFASAFEFVVTLHILDFLIVNSTFENLCLKIYVQALAGVAQWIEWTSVACEPKGRWFNSQSGHMPGLQARSPVGGVWKVTDPCISGTQMFLSLSFSLPSPLSKNK